MNQKKRPILTKNVTLNPNSFNPKFFRTFLYLIFLNKQNFPIKILRGDGLEAARMVGQMCIFSKELKTISAKQSFWVKSIWQVCFCKVINNIADICIINIIKCQCFKLVQNSTKCFENWKWNYFSYFLTSNQKPTFTKYCHNPNSTSTQPQLNSTELGLTWLLLFTPTPPTTTTNSTSNRNKGPSDLKFCMRPHLTKLTTTQYNSKCPQLDRAL